MLLFRYTIVSEEVKYFNNKLIVMLSI